MQYWKTVWALARMLTKRYLRDKTALFFTFIFPIIFLFVFGGLFRNANPQFEIAIINNANTPYSRTFLETVKSQSETFKIKEVTSFDDARKKMGRGEIDSILQIPKEFGVTNAQGRPSGNITVYYKEGDAQAGQTFASVMKTVLTQLNAKFITEHPPFALEQKALQTANLTQFDYTFSGLLGFSLLSLGIFSMANGFTGDKKEGSLRRLETTPLKPSQLIIATGINRLFVGMMVTSLMFAVAAVFLNYHIRGSVISLIVYLIISILMLFGFGMAVSGWAKNENQAAPLANLVAFPMMFLSGSFFPRFLMPAWLQTFSTFLPLTPVIDGLRYILTEGKTLLDLGPQLAVIGAWTIIIYVIAFKSFRWE